MAKFLRHLPLQIREKYKGKLPVPVVAIAEDLGIGIYATNNFKRSESGSIRKDPEGYTIYIKENDSPARKRFTIAHEIGHYLMHSDLLDSGNELVDNVKQPFIQLNRKAGKKETFAEQEREVQANQFAAELLMPEQEFKKNWENAVAIDDVASKFDVSPSAATVRAKELLGTIIV